MRKVFVEPTASNGTDTQTNGHSNIETASAQWANSVKIQNDKISLNKWYSFYGCETGTSLTMELPQ